MSINNTLNRYFVMVKIALVMAPILGYFYITSMAAMMQISLQEVLEINPSLTIMLITTMVNPYIAYLVDISQKKLENEEASFAILNMTLLVLAQCLSQNLLYIFLLGLLFYKVTKIYKIDAVKELKLITIKQYFTLGGGSFIVIFIYMLCLFVSLQIA